MICYFNHELLEKISPKIPTPFHYCIEYLCIDIHLFFTPWKTNCTLIPRLHLHAQVQTPFYLLGFSPISFLGCFSISCFAAFRASYSRLRRSFSSAFSRFRCSFSWASLARWAASRFFSRSKYQHKEEIFSFTLDSIPLNSICYCTSLSRDSGCCPKQYTQNLLDAKKQEKQQSLEQIKLAFCCHNTGGILRTPNTGGTHRWRPYTQMLNSVPDSTSI